VLRLGRRVATFDTHAANAQQVVGAITGAEFGAVQEVFGTPPGGEKPGNAAAGG
jgi:hypothetical protein